MKKVVFYSYKASQTLLWISNKISIIYLNTIGGTFPNLFICFFTFRWSWWSSKHHIAYSETDAPAVVSGAPLTCIWMNKLFSLRVQLKEKNCLTQNVTVLMGNGWPELKSSSKRWAVCKYCSGKLLTKYCENFCSWSLFSCVKLSLIGGRSCTFSG